KSQFPNNYERSERIANDFLKAGVQAVAAINIDGHFVHACLGGHFMLYPYVPGRVIKAKQVLPSQAAQIGNIFARLHKIGSSMDVFEGVNFDIHSLAEWEQILPRSSDWIGKNLARQLLK